MSFPECRLLLAAHAALQAGDLLAATQSRMLASTAKWSKPVAAQLDEFMAGLRLALDPTPSPPPKLTRRKAASFFGALGLRAATPAASS